MKEISLVFIGSGLGGVTRYLLYLILFKSTSTLPIYTLLANIIACFIVGFCMEKFWSQVPNETWRLLVIVGFCGGLSTYSTFNYELSSYLQKSQIIPFILYAGLTFTGCLLVSQLGAWMAQGIKD